ncbi:MAG TPA: Tad domain-containing protein [Thermomicrobiales bacterium]|nr:Tad domain-containing protein [Thermomicrobiales bacterium]
MRTVRRRADREGGSVLALVAVSMVAMLALAAFAIDLASLRDAKAESQRAADVIALAGASAFRDLPWSEGATVDEAQTRAIAIARQNQVRADTLDIRDTASTTTTYLWGSVRVVETGSNDVTLNIIPDSQKVRAWVRRPNIRGFFGYLLGWPFGHVQAMATAWATTNGPEVSCLKPFVMPDMWFESDKTTQDVNGNNYMDPITTVTGNTQDGESWKYQPEEMGGKDYYIPYDPNTPPPIGKVQTGYGSGIRSLADYPSDVGLPLLLKPQTGSGNTDPAAERMGNAFWMLDMDPDSNFKAEVRSMCGTAKIGDPVPYDNGSKTAVRQPINDLIQQDPGAEWDNATHQVINSQFPDWTQSPRVVTVGLIDPKYWMANSSNTKPDPGSVFTNFVRIFFEPVDPKGPPTNIQARYIGPAPGNGGGPNGGPLVKVLQLIE